MLVLWSGGCDSTLLLYDLCKQFKDRFGCGCLCPKDHEKVRAISIFHDQLNTNAKKMEAKARIRLDVEFKKRGFTVEHLAVNIQNMQGETRGGCLQTAVWQLAAAPYLLPNEDLYLGYIKEDDVWHIREHLVKAFKGLQELMDNTGDIKFPLEWEYKYNIVERLQSEKLLDLTWWCESPKGRGRCGRCKSCYKMDATFYLLKLRRMREPKVKV